MLVTDAMVRSMKPGSVWSIWRSSRAATVEGSKPGEIVDTTA